MSAEDGEDDELVIFPPDISNVFFTSSAVTDSANLVKSNFDLLLDLGRSFDEDVIIDSLVNLNTVLVVIGGGVPLFCLLVPRSPSESMIAAREDDTEEETDGE